MAGVSVSVTAIIVTYYPEVKRLKELLDRIDKQVNNIIIVDNGTKGNNFVDIVCSSCVNARVIELEDNKGLAYALNVGLQDAKKCKEGYVLLLDQDSLPSDDMVELLLEQSEKLTKSGVQVGAVGPNYTDESMGESPFFRLDRFHLRRVEPDGSSEVEVDHLITSGSLINKGVFEDVGLMEDALFIDYVDTEWCLRAKAKGYQLFGVWSANMSHKLGLQSEIVFGRSIPVHTPLRYYYIFRNGLWLCRRSWVSWEWKMADIRRLLLMFVIFSLLVGDRTKNLRFMLLALWHCVLGKMGKYESAL